MSYKLSMVALSKSILKWVKDQMKEGSEGRAVANVKVSGWLGGECGREVMSACVTMDGKHLITGSDDKTARMWSLGGGSSV